MELGSPAATESCLASSAEPTRHKGHCLNKAALSYLEGSVWLFCLCVCVLGGNFSSAFELHIPLHGKRHEGAEWSQFAFEALKEETCLL